jgi:L-amino acid N-acyltransferase
LSIRLSSSNHSLFVQIERGSKIKSGYKAVKETWMLILRAAREADLDQITEIYNEAALSTTATFDTEAKTLQEQSDWFGHHGDRYPVLVGEIDKHVIGWGSLSKYSDRCAYSETAEASLYIKDSWRKKGIGKQLTEKLLDKGRQAGLHTVLVRITEGNEASIHVVELFGFKPVGVMKEVGCKFGKLLDVYLYQKIY